MMCDDSTSTRWMTLNDRNYCPTREALAERSEASLPKARSVKDFIELNILLNISGRRPSNCVTHGRPLVVYHFITIKKYLKVS